MPHAVAHHGKRGSKAHKKHTHKKHHGSGSGSSNFTKRRDSAVQASLRRHALAMDKSKSHSAAFGSSNISDAAARRREIFLRYSKRPKTVKEIEIQKAYKDRFQNLVVGTHMIQKWLRFVLVEMFIK